MVFNHRLFLFRHGETIWNTESRLQGRLDSSLTKKGRKQAKHYAATLKGHFAPEANLSLFASPLRRVRETVSIMLQELDLSKDCVSWEPRLMECGFGAWQGLTAADIQECFPSSWQKRLTDKWNVPPPDGESYANVHARVSGWMSEAAFQKTNLIVSHGLILRVLRGI